MSHWPKASFLPVCLLTVALLSTVPVALPAQVWMSDSAAGDGYAAGCDTCGQSTCGCESSSCCSLGNCGQRTCGHCGACGWLDNLSLFMGLEGSKQPQDFGVNANFGGRFHANWGIPIVRSAGLGLQLGTAFNATDNAVQVFERVEGSKARTQSYTTLGLFQRFQSGFNWAIGYDYLYQNSFDKFDLGQWRGHFGYWINQCTELGVRFAASDSKSRGEFGAVPVVLDPISQGSIYVRHIWPSSVSTSAWLGIADSHGEVNAALGDLEPTDERFTFGADLHCPLNDHLAIFGEANFITPADTGTVDAYLGIAYYPGGSRHGLTRRFAPILPVANSTSMSVDLSRQ